MTEEAKNATEVEFLEAYVLYQKSSTEIVDAGKDFTDTMKAENPALDMAIQRDRVDNFDAEKAETVAIALGRMGRAYHRMGDALKEQSNCLSRTAGLARVLIEEKEAGHV